VNACAARGDCPCNISESKQQHNAEQGYNNLDWDFNLAAIEKKTATIRNE
jgi:hypothetical protein